MADSEDSYRPKKVKKSSIKTEMRNGLATQAGLDATNSAVAQKLPTSTFDAYVASQVAEESQNPWSSIVVTSTSQAPLPIVNPGMDGSGSTTSYGWLGGTSSSGWLAWITGTGQAFFENGKLKLETLGSGSFVECRNTDWSYNGVTAQSLSISPNTAYVVEFDWITQYVSGDSSGGFAVAILTQQSHNVSAWEHYVFPYIKTNWKGHHKAEFTTSATANYLNISPIIYGHSGAGTLQMKAWLDNIVIYKKSEGVETSYLLGTSGKILWFNPDGSPAVIDTPPISKLTNIPDERNVAQHLPSYYSQELSYEFRPQDVALGSGYLDIPNSHSNWWTLETIAWFMGGIYVIQTAYGDYSLGGTRWTESFTRRSTSGTTWTGWTPLWPDTLLNTAGELTLGSGQSTIFSHTIPADWLKVGDTLDLTLNMYSQLANTSHNLVLELWGTTVGGWASPVTLGTNEQYYLQMNLSLVVTWNSQQKTLTQATWKRMNTGGSLLAYDVVYAPWSPITVTTKDISTALTIALKDYGTQNWYSQYRWTLKKS